MKSRRERLELAFIIGLICIIFLLLMTPFFIRLIIKDQDSSSVNNFNCSSQTLVRAIIDNTECVSEPFTGDLCLQLLATTWSCSVGARSSVLVNASDGRQTLETNLTTFLNILERNGSQQCRGAVLPFMCQYTFPLCDNNTKQLYLPTQERCIEISEQVCSQEWNLTRQLGYQNLLPNCTKLMKQALQNITCRDDFISLNGTCQPRCRQNNIQSSTSIVANRVLRFAGTISTIIGGGAFFIASVIRYKEMYSFPLIILVYMTVDLFVTGITLLVLETGFPDLLCGSASLTESILNPTVFCLISGAVFHYTIVGIFVFWTFHNGYFFYKVMFPFHAKAHQSYKKYIHLIMAIFGFLVPLPAVITAIAVDNSRYSITTYFLPVCITKNPDLNAYSINLVITILLFIPAIFLIIIIWKVRKHSQMTPERGPMLSTAEKKLLFVMSLQVLSGLFLFVSAVAGATSVRTQESQVLEYFSCESDGYVPGKCNRAAVQQDTIVWYYSLTFVLLATAPFVTLFFVVKFKTVKEKMMSLLHGSNTQSRPLGKEQNLHSLQNSRDELRKSTSEQLDKTSDN